MCVSLTIWTSICFIFVFIHISQCVFVCIQHVTGVCLIIDFLWSLKTWFRFFFLFLAILFLWIVWFCVEANISIVFPHFESTLGRCMIINNTTNTKWIDVAVAAIAIVYIRLVIRFFVILSWQKVAKSIWRSSIVPVILSQFIDTVADVQLIWLIIGSDGPFKVTTMIWWQSAIVVWNTCCCCRRNWWYRWRISVARCHNDWCKWWTRSNIIQRNGRWDGLPQFIVNLINCVRGNWRRVWFNSNNWGIIGIWVVLLLLLWRFEICWRHCNWTWHSNWWLRCCYRTWNIWYGCTATDRR